MFLFLQYMKSTQIMRVHRRHPMTQNIPAYYRAFENMVNRSELKDQVIHGGVQLTVTDQDFSINEQGVSF